MIWSVIWQQGQERDKDPWSGLCLQVHFYWSYWNYWSSTIPSLCVCVLEYIYIYIHRHTHTYTHCSWAAAFLCAGQLPHLFRQRNRENRNSPAHHQFTHGENFPPSLSSLLSLHLPDSFGVTVIEKHLEGEAVFFACVFLGRSGAQIICLPPH